MKHDLCLKAINIILRMKYIQKFIGFNMQVFTALVNAFGLISIYYTYIYSFVQLRTMEHDDKSMYIE